MDTTVQIDENVLDIRLDRFALAVRTQNCLRREGICTVAQLVILTPNNILNWDGAGIKTLEDIRNLLGGMGLALAEDSLSLPLSKAPVFLKEVDPQIDAPVENSISLSQADPALQKRLVSRLIDYDLSVRAKNVLAKKKIVFLGQLVQTSIRDLRSLKNVGQKTVNELISLLEKYGLKPDTKIVDWSGELVKQIGIPEAEKKLLKPTTQSGGSPTCLEEELDGIVRLLMKDRNADILTKLWGWNGKGRRTLESVGSEFALTRERVRQIEAKALKRLKRLKFELSFVPEAIKAFQEILPATREQLNHRLSQIGVAKHVFDPTGLEFAAEILERKWPIFETTAFGHEFYVHLDDLVRFSKICSSVRRRTSDSGCLNITSLSSEVGFSENRQDALRKYLDLMPGLVWLDGASDWLYLKDSPRNRLYNLCSKVLAVCPRIRISELRKAAAKSRRLAMAPPQKVLAAFLESTKLARIEDGYALANSSMTVPPKPDSVEGKLLQVLDECGPVLGSDDFAEKCIAKGVNATSFYINKLISPVISAVATGIYCKVGAEIPLGLIEEIKQRKKESPRISDHGWTPSGSLWFGAELSRVVITSGSIVLHSFVADFVQGEWSVDLPDGGIAEKVVCRDTFIWTFRKAFSLFGLESGDVIVLEFDIKSRHLTLHVGGGELLETFQEPQPEDADDMASLAAPQL